MRYSKCERWCFVLLLLSINVSRIRYVSVVRVVLSFVSTIFIFYGTRAKAALNIIGTLAIQPWNYMILSNTGVNI